MFLIFSSLFFELRKAANARPNQDLDTLNNLSGIGCQLVALEDENLMAVSKIFFKDFNSCGRERF